MHMDAGPMDLELQDLMWVLELNSGPLEEQ